jgi:predicted nucleic acid-binding protein
VEKAKLYDTSAIIELVLRRGCKTVLGATSILTIVEWPPALLYVPEVLYPTKEDYTTAVNWQMKLRRMGNPLPAVDLLIAAIALNNDMTLVTLNSHFQIIEEIEPRLRIETL